MSTLQPLPLAHLIRRYRLAAGLSQEALAERSGLSTRAISDLERGLRTAPRPETVRMLTVALSLNSEQHAAFLQAVRPDLWQRQHDPDERAERERPQTHRPHTRSLPISPTPLIGREDAVARICSMLENEDVRLVTLTGQGGVGKTRLAVAVAARAAANFADGAVFVDLAPLSQPDQVAPAIAEALGITLVARRPMIDVVAQALELRSLLLVVDNFEHLLEAATDIANLLGACLNLKILVTSRERLHLRGEYVAPVNPLELPPTANEKGNVALADVANYSAVLFFQNRAQEVNFGFTLTDENAQLVSEICRRLEGLPLAIELAASRTRLLNPAALLARLDRRLAVLTEGARDAPPRQQTMRDTIAWSYDHLTNEEQALFRRLSVFSGGISPAAAAAVASALGDFEIDPLSGLDSLAEKSLIGEVAGEMGQLHFRMLEIIREFALDRLVSVGEEAAARQAHAQWFLDMSIEAEGDLRFGKDQFAWFVEIDQELGNLRSAMSWFQATGDGAGLLRIATALDEYWFSHSLYREYLFWLAAGRTLEPVLDPVVDGWALCLESSATRLLDDLDACRRSAREALEVAQSSGDPFLLGRAYLGNALLSQSEGDFRRKVELCERAVPNFEKAGASNYLALTLVEIGSAYQRLGELTAAAARIDQGIALMRTTGDDWALGMTTVIRGNLSLANDEPHLAAEMFREATLLSRQANDERTLLFSLNGLARLALQEGDAERATQLLGAGKTRKDNWVDAPATTVHLFDDAVETAQADLGPEAFQRAWESGCVLPFDTVLEMAVAFSDEIISRRSERGAQCEQRC